MTESDEFDQFYKDVRARLLLLTYCLTGDLPSSRAAVRDAFVVAWHHWRKVSRHDDPEAWVREHACRHAQRRHTAKLWHREKGLDPEVKATLAALGKLPMSQRRVLLLTELTSGSFTDLAREAGLPRAEAERQLQSATATFALERQVPTTSVRAVLEGVRTHLDGVSWPRASILRRSGAARRRTHTVIGVAATGAALVVTGTVVTEGAAVRPTLAGERAASIFSAPTEEPAVLPEDALLGTEAVARVADGPVWSIASTTDNTTGDGLVMPCQASRYAGPRQPDAALVRVFGSESRGKQPAPRVVQAVQAAPTERAAERAYARAVDWFAACDDAQAQLLGTYDLPGVGDAAILLELRTWGGPNRTLLAGVARTGQFTTVTASSTAGDGGPKPRVLARLLGSGVDRLCELTEGGNCTTRAVPRPTAPVAVGDVPGMLAEVDLPPAKGVDEPWVGTEPRKATVNAAATGCDRATFASGGISNNLTRTFLVPEADLPAEFGLTESVGTLPATKAKAFVADVRDRLGRCEDKQMGTEVTRLRHVEKSDRDLTVWRVTTEVTDQRSISFLMGVVRDGSAVAQIGFVPVKGVSLSDDDFGRLVERAQQRLAAMPAPR